MSVLFSNLFIISNPKLQCKILINSTTSKSKPFSKDFHQLFCGTILLFTELKYKRCVKTIHKIIAHAFFGNQLCRMMLIAKEELLKWLDNDTKGLIARENYGRFYLCNKLNLCVLLRVFSCSPIRMKSHKPVSYE